MLRASIDLGTNTCLLLVAEIDATSKRVLRVIEDHSNIVRLGQGVDQTKLLHPDAIVRTENVLKRYSERVRELKILPSDVIAVATSQARDAQNGADFFNSIKEKTGFHFRTLTGDEEARFTFLGGLLPNMNPNESCVVDIGGGSTELMSTSGGKSLDIGSVRFHERYLKSNPVKDEEFWTCREAIDSGLSTMISWRSLLTKSSKLCAVAGTATTLAALHLQLPKFDRDKIDGAVLTRGDLHRLVEELKWRTTEERTLLPSMEPLRADVILAGALILWRTLEVLDFKECTVSTRGLRYGVFSI